MPNLKFILTVFAICNAQFVFSQFNIGLKAGGNLNTMMFDIDRDFGREPETKTKVGFHLGITSDITLIENTLSLQAGILYNNKGYSVDFEQLLQDEVGTDVDIDDFEGYLRLNYNYIELPINFAYKYGNYQIYAGPYLAFGIGGTFKNDFSFEADGEKFTSDDIYDERTYRIDAVYGIIYDNLYEDYLDDEDVIDLYRGFDYGLNFGLGYQLNQFLFNINYSLGLNNVTARYDAEDYNVDEDYTENIVLKNRVLSFSASYFLFKN